MVRRREHVKQVFASLLGLLACLLMSMSPKMEKLEKASGSFAEKAVAPSQLKLLPSEQSTGGCP